MPTLSGPQRASLEWGARNRKSVQLQQSCRSFRPSCRPYRGPRKSLIFGESGGLGRPLIKWSGNQPCDPSAERDVAHTLPPPLGLLSLPDRFANLGI